MFGFVPTSDISRRIKQRCYSITSSARASSVGEISSPSVFAVLRLRISSNLIGCWIGSSPGFVPARMRET